MQVIARYAALQIPEVLGLGSCSSPAGTCCCQYEKNDGARGYSRHSSERLACFTDLKVCRSNVQERPHVQESCIRDSLVQDGCISRYGKAPELVVCPCMALDFPLARLH